MPTATALDTPQQVAMLLLCAVAIGGAVLTAWWTL